MGLLRKGAARLYHNLQVKEHELLYLFLEVTRRCNLNCLHCGSDCKNDPLSAGLPLEKWFEVVDYAAAFFPKELAFVVTGGEPLLFDGLEALGMRISEQNRRWGMVTNGMLLTEEKMRTLTDAGLYSVTLSFDGARKAHNELRNHPKAYNHLHRALKAVSLSSVRHKDAVTCVYPGNIADLPFIAENLIDYGFSSWRVFRIFPSGRAKNNDKLQLDFSHTRKLLNWVKENREFYKKRGLNLSYSCEGYMPLEESIAVRGEPFFCRAGVNIASVLYDGTLTGCSNNAPDFHVGNFFDGNFAEIWEQGFTDFRDRSWTHHGSCADCEVFRDCRGSSIHLYPDKSSNCAFCYVKDLNSLQKQ